MKLHGSGVAPGIAVGRITLSPVPRGEVRSANRPALPPAQEQRRLTEAIGSVAASLSAACAQPDRWPREVLAIVNGHRLILKDQAFCAPMLARIDSFVCTAEEALEAHQRHLMASLEGIDDPYVSARREELGGLFASVLAMLARDVPPGDPGSDTAQQAPDRSSGSSSSTGAPPGGDMLILVSADPAPTDLLLHDGTLAGVVSERGGHLSHTSIVARSLQLPYVAGISGAGKALREGELIIVDGDAGLVVTEPDTATVQRYRERQQSLRSQWQSLQAFPIVGPVSTQDGEAIEIMANVRGPQDIADACRLQVDGVGLYRTEFLYANRSELPDEEEHFEVYHQLCEGMEGRPVTIRTLDICAGPQLQSMGLQVPRSAQPALGLRAIRLCLQYPELFAPQIRALLRAASHGPVRIILPMISTIAELHQALAFIEDCRLALQREGVACAEQLPVGVMVEVPAAALCAPGLAAAASFLSIGTNDLIQYALAIDREDDTVQKLYDAANPGVLRLIHGCITAARDADVPVSLCGEMAGDPRFTRLLLALGLKSFSMRPNAVPEVRSIIADTRLEAIRPLATDILDCHCPARSRELLDALNAVR